MKHLALLLVAVLSARAETLIVEPTELEPGYVGREAVQVYVSIGVLTLKAPGTYTAPSWTINGELRLGEPGNYTLVASAGSIVFNRQGTVRGTDGLGAVPYRLTFAHSGDFRMDADRIDPTISITQGALPVIEPPPLVNISTRVTLASGQTHTSGFVVGGKVMRRILLRAIGPTLGSFGVANALPTPVVTVYNNQTPLFSNSGWAGNTTLAAIFPRVGAFALPSNSRDAAMTVDLNPGSYTVQVGGGSGEVLLEIYYVD